MDQLSGLAKLENCLTVPIKIYNYSPLTANHLNNKKDIFNQAARWIQITIFLRETKLITWQPYKKLSCLKLPIFRSNVVFTSDVASLGFLLLSINHNHG